MGFLDAFVFVFVVSILVGALIYISKDERALARERRKSLISITNSLASIAESLKK